MKRKLITGFAQSDVPPRDSVMNKELIRQMAEGSPPISQQEALKLVEDHIDFLNSGGARGKFERLHISGLPMNIYTGAKGSRGSQFEIRMKRLQRGIKLEDTNLSFADFSGALCEAISFKNSTFDFSIMTDAFFADANFEGASFAQVDFTGSDLTNANFRNADLRGADFEIANCEGADFTGAKLDRAVFPGTNLDHIKR